MHKFFLFSGKFMERTTSFPFLIFFSLLTCSASSFAGHYEDYPCTSSRKISCYMTVPADSLGDIQWDPQPSDSKICFRKKSSPDKLFRFEDGSNIEGTKGSLAVLLTAATNGMDVRVFIISGDYNNNSVSSFFKDVVLIPYNAQ